MITLVGAIIGLLGSFLPDLLGLFKAKQKLDHDLAVLEVQASMAAAGHKFKMEEVNAEADIREVEAIHDEFAKRGATWKWVEALISSVRPVLTYAFFALYTSVKVSALTLALSVQDGNVARSLQMIWHEPDQAIFATIIAFWFGARSLQKFRQNR